MPMIDAFRLIARCRSDAAFRASSNGRKDGKAVREFWEDCGFAFTDDDVRNALKSVELRAADEEEAAEIRELGQWFRFVAGEAPLNPGGRATGSGCDTASCGGSCPSCGAGVAAP